MIPPGGLILDRNFERSFVISVGSFLRFLVIEISSAQTTSVSIVGLTNWESL